MGCIITMLGGMIRRLGGLSREDSVADDPNLYGYCGQNPVNRIDPSGNFSLGPIQFQSGLGLFLASANAIATLTGDKNLSNALSTFNTLISIVDIVNKVESDTKDAQNNIPSVDPVLRTKLGDTSEINATKMKELKLKLGIVDKGFFGNLSDWINQKILGSSKFIEATIITEDGKTIQFVADASNNKNINGVLNAYANATTLGLKVTLTTVNGNSRTLVSANNFGSSNIGQYLGKAVTSTVFEKLWGQGVEEMYETVFPKGISYMAKGAGKLAARSISIFNIVNKAQEINEFTEKYRYNQKAEDFWYLSLALTADPHGSIFDEFGSSTLMNEKGLTYEGLVEAGKAASSHSGLLNVYQHGINKMSSFCIDYISLFIP